MIEITNRDNCCGCEACVQTCPRHCVRMEEDNEGFNYPKTDKSLCINCGLCESVCPMASHHEERAPLACFAAKNLNDEERFLSSSGGVFIRLAKQVLSKGGVVFGALFNEKWEVIHSYTENPNELIRFMGSKYVQSRIGTSYLKVELFLKAGREVLFSGTPCQIAGLKSFLKREYDNLITIDVVCHGVPSPGIFRWYLYEEILKTINGRCKKRNNITNIYNIPDKNILSYIKNVEIKSIRFRDKNKGWKRYGISINFSIIDGNGKSNLIKRSIVFNKDLYMKGYLKNVYLRPSCYNCKFRCFKSESDVTLGDFWGIGHYFPQFDDDKGTSIMFIHTSKIKLLLNNGYKVIPVSYSMTTPSNMSIIKSPSVPKERSLFFNNSDQTFSERIDKLCAPSLMELIASYIQSGHTFIRNKVRLFKCG